MPSWGQRRAKREKGEKQWKWRRMNLHLHAIPSLLGPQRAELFIKVAQECRLKRTRFAATSSAGMQLKNGEFLYLKY